MKTLELRTSLFRFDPTQLGRAYRVVIGEHYLDAWQAWGFHAHLDTHSTNTWTVIPR